MKELLTKIKDNHETVTAVGSIAGNFLTAAALVATIIISSCQLGIMNRSLDASIATSTRQLELTQRSLQNGLIYNMQKDQRAVASDYFSGKSDDTGPIFAHMHSIYLQRKLGSVPDDVWSVFDLDFCRIMIRERLRRDWDNITKDILSPEFVSYVDRLRQSPRCPGGKP
jgi:hypothetical protein